MSIGTGSGAPVYPRPPPPGYLAPAMSPPSWLPAAAQPAFSRLTTLTPGVAFAAGILALLWGGTLWRVTSTACGLAIGGWAGFALGHELHSEAIGWVAAVALGVGTAVVFYLVERIAVAGIGAAIGTQLAGWVWPLVQHREADVAVLAGGALLGGLLTGLLHRRAIQALAAIAGAASIAWAVGEPGNPLLILGLGAFGAWFQGRGAGAPAAKPAKVKKKKKED